MHDASGGDPGQVGAAGSSRASSCTAVVQVIVKFLFGLIRLKVLIGTFFVHLCTSGSEVY